jgi:methionine-rich copper-binding protein CopC
MRRATAIISALLVISANLFFGSAAQAHDDVTSVQPESGSSVEAGIIDLNVNFNEEVLLTSDGSGFEVVVANASGELQTVGCISPMGNTLSARAALATAGDYTVSWRSVSADGHPIEGSYKFSVSNSAEVDADLINNCPRLLIAPAPESIEDPEAIAYSSAGEAVANDNTALEIGLLIAVVAMVVFFAIWVTARRKKSKN